MKIDWLGHCCFRFVESTGTTIISDPYDPSVLGCALPPLTADAVTCSHNHPNHAFTGSIDGNPLILDHQGSFEVKGVYIESIKSKRTDGTENLIFRYHMDGVDLCHLGDIGIDCTPDLVEEVAPVDILLLPIGGHPYTIDAETACDFVNLLMPEVVIPMHYRMDECDNDFDFDSLKDFLRNFDDDAIEFSDKIPLEFKRDHFRGKGCRVLIPSRAK